MEWYFILLIAAAATVGIVAAVCFACRIRKNKRKKRAVARNEGVTVEEVSADEIDETSLCEIDDPGLAERVKSLMPDAIRAEISAGLVVTTASKTVYRVILPASTKLASASASGGIAAMGASMAAAQVGTLVASSFTAVMSAASMVVGQYYMTLVNAQLKKISETLSRLGGFQDNEFRSKVFALHAQVCRSAEFRLETASNAHTRAAEIEKLNRMEHECIELLGQAALTISDIVSRNDLDYPKYVGATSEVEKWFASQKILLATLREIADLRFALSLGAASREQCDALLPVYERQAEETRRMLLKWHTETADRLGVRLGEGKRKRKGLDKVVHWLPGLFKKELRYKDVPASTVALIESQIAESLPEPADRGDLFRSDVEIIAKDGKLYYLPKDRPDPER